MNQSQPSPQKSPQQNNPENEDTENAPTVSDTVAKRLDAIVERAYKRLDIETAKDTGRIVNIVDNPYKFHGGKL